VTHHFQWLGKNMGAAPEALFGEIREMRKEYAAFGQVVRPTA
jgi:hypothetical protein